ncbi:cyclopropane fatty acid synthase domain-containing protein [Pisolithus sp. B1]|nr:cyclopropane fatty acid synthase domain-containing protein [Pisolithus sp. B1]
MSSTTVRVTDTPAIKNAPVAGLAEGNGYFSNTHLAILVLGVPFFVKRILPIVNRGGFKTYVFLVIVLGVPITVAYWTVASMYGKRKNLKSLYQGKEKIPMQIFHDAYFDGKIDFNGDVLEIMEQRHDWAKMVFTPELFKYVFANLLPEVIVHSQSQDEEQGDDFYEWTINLSIVCSKLNLQPHDRLLDTKFGNDRIKNNGVTPDKARILCMDYRDIPGGPGHYTKIVSLEMAEHVGIRRYGSFMRQMYELLDDDGIFVLQVAGIRPSWQYEDLIWGLFMNKYIFPGADASCSLGWVVSQVEAAGFEVKNIDVLGVHYSATLMEMKVVEKYGERWYRIWVFFLAWSTIISRQGSASVFQLTLHKNLNAYHRVNGIPSHASIHVQEREQRDWVSIE